MIATTPVPTTNQNTNSRDIVQTVTCEFTWVN